MIHPLGRTRLLTRIEESLAQYPITVLLGARQVGKTHLSQAFATSPDHYFDLERSDDLVRLSDNALSTLGALNGRVVIDEAQELPVLFKTLRVLADRPNTPARFIVTGSVAPSLLESVSESLAGRASIMEIGGFDLDEVAVDHWKKHWLRGGHPPSYLAPTDDAAYRWRENYLSALIGKDLRIWSRSELPPAQVRKLLNLIADSTGQAWNNSAAASVLEISYKTVQSYVEVLKGAFIIRELPPLEANVRKRIRQSPTLMIRDTGILHSLLRIGNEESLFSHPRKGFSWEAYCTDQVIRLGNIREENCFRYSVQGGAEIDLVVDLPGRRIGFEFKSGDSPGLKPSMKTGRDDLELSMLYVISPGDRRRLMDDRIESVGIERLTELCSGIFE